MVNVLQISSFVFAPRVEFAEPFNAVFVDGKRWDYHDGRHVFLPNRRGMYRIAVRDGMPPQASDHKDLGGVKPCGAA